MPIKKGSGSRQFTIWLKEAERERVVHAAAVRGLTQTEHAKRLLLQGSDAAIARHARKEKLLAHAE